MQKHLRNTEFRMAELKKKSILHIQKHLSLGLVVTV